MERKVVSGIMLTLLLVGMLTLAFNIQPVEAEPKTIYVDDDNTTGPWNGTPQNPYQNITAALEHASVDDTIYVYNGTYYEHVGISKSISLIGESKYNTIIDGNYTGTVVSITANNVTISGFTIQNGGDGWVSGIDVDYSSDNNISNNIITSNLRGIRLGWNSNDNVLACNDVSNNDVGIALSYSSDNTIIGNTFSSNTENGTWLWLSDNNIFIDNAISGNRLGIGLLDSFNNSFTGNIISLNTGCGIIVESSDHNPTNNLIYHNNFINNTQQFYSDGSTSNWDDGYPSGGNYWSDYNGTDLYRGSYQNETGNDDIGDTPYVIDENNQDNYPLMNPWTPETPESRIRELISDVEDMNLQQGIDNSLDAKLTATLDALEALNADQRNDAINKLYAFINEVEAQRGKKLTNEQADYLVATAQEIISLID